MMVIYRVKNYEEMSQKAASLISEQILKKPDSVLGLATGSSPIGTYQNLIKAYEKGVLDFSKIVTINLDEYKGLSPENAQSYRYYMDKNFFEHINIDKNNTYIPDGMETDTEKACKEYNELISFHGIDLQLLGIGTNGHIGFNEPNTIFIPETHCVDLAESTIDANKRFFTSIDEVPRQAYTMGIQNIMSAKRIILIVSGSNKAEILARVINGPIDPQVPASILQLHNDVIIIADEAALSLL